MQNSQGHVPTWYPVFHFICRAFSSGGGVLQDDEANALKKFGKQLLESCLNVLSTTFFSQQRTARPDAVWHAAGAAAAGVSTNASLDWGSEAGAHPALLPPAPALHPGPAGPGQGGEPVHPPLPPPPGNASGGVNPSFQFMPVKLNGCVLCCSWALCMIVYGGF